MLSARWFCSGCWRSSIRSCPSVLLKFCMSLWLLEENKTSCCIHLLLASFSVFYSYTRACHKVYSRRQQGHLWKCYDSPSFNRPWNRRCLEDIHSLGSITYSRFYIPCVISNVPLCCPVSLGSWPWAADTRFTVEDVSEALLKQLKTAKEPGIVVKQPEEEYVRFNNFGKNLICFAS